MSADIEQIVDGICDDVRTLAMLHDAELSCGALQTLKEINFPDSMSLLPWGKDGRMARQAMREAIAALPDDAGERDLDELAADYAEIYITGALGASPYESVWTDDDHLICQDAMFELRALYARLGFATPNWRKRPDDHLVLQLLYIAEAAVAARTPVDWRNLANALDMHLMQWLPEFSARIVARSRSQFYTSLAVLTCTWIETLRSLIAAYLGEPRPQRETLRKPRRSQQHEVAPIHFVPGTSGPSW